MVGTVLSSLFIQNMGVNIGYPKIVIWWSECRSTIKIFDILVHVETWPICGSQVPHLALLEEASPSKQSPAQNQEISPGLTSPLCKSGCQPKINSFIYIYIYIYIIHIYYTYIYYTYILYIYIYYTYTLYIYTYIYYTYILYIYIIHIYIYIIHIYYTYIYIIYYTYILYIYILYIYIIHIYYTYILYIYIIHVYYTYILYIYIIHIYYTYILYIYDFHWISMNFLYWRVLSVSSPFIFRIAPSGLQAGSQTGQGQLGHWTRLGLRWTQHANGLALARHVEMPTAGMVFSNVEYHLNVIRTSYEYHMNQIFGYIWIIWDLCPHRCKVNIDIYAFRFICCASSLPNSSSLLSNSSDSQDDSRCQWIANAILSILSSFLANVSQLTPTVTQIASPQNLPSLPHRLPWEPKCPPEQHSYRDGSDERCDDGLSSLTSSSSLWASFWSSPWSSCFLISFFFFLTSWKITFLRKNMEGFIQNMHTTTLTRFFPLRSAHCFAERKASPSQPIYRTCSSDGVEGSAEIMHRKPRIQNYASWKPQSGCRRSGYLLETSRNIPGYWQAMAISSLKQVHQVPYSFLLCQGGQLQYRGPVVRLWVLSLLHSSPICGHRTIASSRGQQRLTVFVAFICHIFHSWIPVQQNSCSGDQVEHIGSPQNVVIGTDVPHSPKHHQRHEGGIPHVARLGSSYKDTIHQICREG